MTEWIRNAYNIIKGTVKKFGTENGSLIAAAISFYATLSLLPLLLLAVSVVGYLLGSSERAFSTVTNLAGQFIPSTEFIDATLHGLIQARGTIGIIGLVALLWTGSQLFVTLQLAMNDIWEVERKPGFIVSKLKAILLELVFGVCMALSIGSTSLVALAHSLVPQLASGPLGLLLRIVAFVLGLAFAILMFLIVYKYAPSEKVAWRSALAGAVFAGAAWTIAKELYALYLEYADFSKLYGSLGSVVILILWIYYSSVILVMGGELAYVSEHETRNEP